MAQDKPSAEGPVELHSRDVARLVVVLLGVALVIAAFSSPWWTRGLTLDKEGLEDSEWFFPPGSEGNYYDYGPFQIPASAAGSSDSGRAAAVAILGVAAVVATLFIAAHLVLRYLSFRDKVAVDSSVPVRLAIAAVLVGAFTILWAGLFLPLAGPNAGFLYGDEPAPSGSFFNNDEAPFQVTRYANAGFFFGIVAFVAFPAYLWVDASASRMRLEQPLDTGKTARDAVSF